MKQDDMQEALKFILVAVSAGVIGYIGWTVYGEGTQTTAARMSESVHLAQAQAQNMNQSLTNVSVIGKAGLSALPQDTTPSSIQAVATLEVTEIANLETLMAEWKPRYDAAKLSYAKFHASITNAKSRAADYFAQQQALTQSMRDPDNKAKAELEDEAELALYRRWQAQADLALEKADKIGIQLDDMNANLNKMELRADFVFDTSAFLGVPEAINELNLQLFEFQVASENIKLTAGSPFEARQR